jgi:hypothetical protein
MYFNDKQIVIDAKQLLLLIRENPGATTEELKQKMSFTNFIFSLNLLFKHDLIYKKQPLVDGKRPAKFYEKLGDVDQ